MQKADKIFVNGEVITVDRNNSVAEAVAVVAGRIMECGTTDQILQLAGPATLVFDLEGKCLLPGFIDSHVHFIQTGLNGLGIDLRSAKDLEDILARIRNYLEEDGEERVVRGIGYDEVNLAEKRPPTRWELDKVCPDKPLWLCRIDSHSCVVNSKLLQLINIDGMDGVSRDPAGQPDGILRGAANNIARNAVLNMIDESTRRKAALLAQQLAFQAGITAVNAMEGGRLFHQKDFEVLRSLGDELKLDIEIFLQTTDVDMALELGLKRIGGCIILDGSVGSRTAALSQGYIDQPENKGVLYYTQEEIDRFVMKAHSAGLQVSVHAIGDRAIQQILSAYRKAVEKFPRKDHRHRIEHFEYPTEDQIELASRLGIIPSMQPAFDYYWGGARGMYGIRLGEERAFRMNPFREILDRGCMVLGGSDSDVTPMNPLLGIHAGVNHSNPLQRMKVVEAIRAFTINGAYGIFKEKAVGSIEKGKQADFVLLSQNPLKVNPTNIKDIRVEGTVKKGEWVYTA